MGKAEITVEGLYYCISCVLSLPHRTVYKVFLLDGSKRLNLGTCVPDEGYFALKKRIPAKHLDIKDKIAFIVDDGRCEKEKQNYLLNPNEPFAMLSELSSARFEMREGKGYIVFD